VAVQMDKRVFRHGLPCIGLLWGGDSILARANAVGGGASGPCVRRLVTPDIPIELAKLDLPPLHRGITYFSVHLVRTFPRSTLSRLMAGFVSGPRWASTPRITFLVW
jgi:hypothetical protein